MSEQVPEVPGAAVQTRFDDGYEYPSIYKEVDHMINASNLIYCFSTLRDLEWRQKKVDRSIDATFDEADFMRPEIDEETQLFKTPLPIGDIGAWVERNFEELRKYKDFFASSEDSLKQVVQLSGSSNRDILYIEDSDGDEKEIVYGISIDHVKKRLIVCFRGTATPKDIRSDVKITQKKVVLPNSSVEVNIHRGFHAYLFDKDLYKERFGSVDIDKYTSIMNKLVPLVEKHPGFKVYITGHSLGAGLSSLFAFSAAQSDKLPKPVTCVSIASPYCGGAIWRQEFMELERRGQIRYVRVANASDVISHGPPFDLTMNLYKHVGLNLRLERETMFNSNCSFRFQYAVGYYAELCHSFTNNSFWNFSPLSALQMHGCPEYLRRLNASKEELSAVKLNDVYESYLKQLE